MMRCAIKKLLGILPRVNEGATTSHRLPHVAPFGWRVGGVPQLVTRGFRQVGARGFPPVGSEAVVPQVLPVAPKLRKRGEVEIAAGARPVAGIVLPAAD